MRIHLVTLSVLLGLTKAEVLMGLTKAEPPLLDLSPGYDLDPPASHRVKIIEKGLNRIYIGVELDQKCSIEHKGAHLEAPVPFGGRLGAPVSHDSQSWSVENSQSWSVENSQSWSVENIPCQRLWRVPGVLMDASRKDPENYEITAEELQAWEGETGLSIPSGGILLIKTGWISEGKLSIDDDGDNETLPQQPRLSEDAGAWLANYESTHGPHKGVFAVGIDLDSLDGRDQNTSTSARARLFEKGIYALNNLKNLEMLPKSGFLVTAMPMKIFKGVGAPARVMAEREDTRSEPDDSDEGDDESHYNWSVERDYSSSHSSSWGYDGHDVPYMMMSSASTSGLYSVALVVMPVLVALMN